MHTHPITKRIIPDKPGPNHEETLRIQREREPVVNVILHCTHCDKKSVFQWKHRVELDAYRKGHLNCHYCYEFFPKPKPGISRNGYGGFYSQLTRKLPTMGLKHFGLPA